MPLSQPQQRAHALNHNAEGSRGLVINLVCGHLPINQQLKSLRASLRPVREAHKLLQTRLAGMRGRLRRLTRERRLAILARIYTLEGEGFLTRLYPRIQACLLFDTILIPKN